MYIICEATLCFAPLGLAFYKLLDSIDYSHVSYVLVCVSPIFSLRASPVPQLEAPSGKPPSAA